MILIKYKTTFLTDQFNMKMNSVLIFYCVAYEFDNALKNSIIIITSTLIQKINDWYYILL